MRWFQKHAKKPPGLYQSSIPEYSCSNCAYLVAGTCQIHKDWLLTGNLQKLRCADFLNKDTEQRQAFQETQYALQAPHAIMHPRVFPDGDRWCALYGENLQEGVAGFGKTPESACADFDHNWRSQRRSQRAAMQEGKQ